MKTCGISKRWTLWSWWVLLGSLTIWGCSGGYSFTGASIPPQAKTVCVKQFPNYAPTVNPQLSQQFSDALRNLFSSQTPLTVVSSEGDLHIEGEITDYRTQASAVSSGDEVSMNRLTIGIKVRFTNRYDEEADFEQSFSRYRDYNAQQDFASIESALVEQIVNELIEDVFNKAVVNW